MTLPPRYAWTKAKGFFIAADGPWVLAADVINGIVATILLIVRFFGRRLGL